MQPEESLKSYGKFFRFLNKNDVWNEPKSVKNSDTKIKVKTFSTNKLQFAWLYKEYM